MVRFEPKDRVRYRVRRPHQAPTFQGGGTVLSVSEDGQTVTVNVDIGGPYPYPAKDLELETPDPAREEKPTMVRRKPYPARG
jgi:multidrug efflux pump subunit AcrA (membrane-fusion protein)